MSASRGRRWRISPLWPRTRIVAAATLPALGALLAGAPHDRASAAPLASCTPTHGTIVAVDFAHWGGPIVRGCGVGRHSGLALLHAAGFTTAGDEHDGPGVVCRLGDAAFRHGTQYPTPAQQGCVQTPPTTGYWAYWVAPAGSDHWAYSPLGAIGDVPRPGEVELWIFGATNLAGTHGTGVPTFRPAALRARAAARTHPSATRTPHTPPTTTRTRATATTRTTKARTHAPGPPGARTETSRTATTTRRAAAPTHAQPHRAAHASTRARPHARPQGEPRSRSHRRRGAAPRASHPHTATSRPRTSTRRAGGARIVSARPTSRRTSAGSAMGLILGAALALLVSAGAGRAIWVRRRQE